MSQAPRYEINLNHGDMHISLESDDVYFISKQMNQWLKIFLDDNYVPVTVPERPAPAPKAPAPKPVAKKPAPPQEEERYVPRHHQATEVADDDYAPPLPKPQSKPQPQPQPQAKSRSVSLPGEEAADIPEYRRPVAPPPPPERHEVIEESVMAEEEVVLSHLEADFASSEDDESVAESAETPVEAKDDFEVVMDSLMKDLDDDGDDLPSPFRNPAGKPLPASRPLPPTARPAKQPAASDHYEQVRLPVGVLDDEDELAATPTLQPVAANTTPIDSLADLCDRATAATSEDFLVLTAYYLDQFEGVEKFSLKRINSLLVKSGLTPVNFSVLESALSNSVLAMVPDLTGTADVSEYSLTEQGKTYAGSLF